MESAIPEHLRTTRTRHRRIPDDFAPPYPSFVARHIPRVERVVMAYFGVQSRGEPSKAAAQAVARIASSFEATGGPSHCDRAEYLDEAGFTNVVTAAYWDDRAKFDGWFPMDASNGPATGEAMTDSARSSSCSIQRWRVTKPCSPHWDAPRASLSSPPA